MKIAIASSCVPFVIDQYDQIRVALAEALVDAGHDVEVVMVPQIDNPDVLMIQMLAFRLIDLSQAERLICLRPQAHMIEHPRKVVWLVKEPLAGLHAWNIDGFPIDNAEAQARLDVVRGIDSVALGEARRVYVATPELRSHLLSDRAIVSMLLRPPPLGSRHKHKQSATPAVVCLASGAEETHLYDLIHAFSLCSAELDLHIILVSTINHDQYQRILQHTCILNKKNKLYVHVNISNNAGLSILIQTCIKILIIRMPSDCSSTTPVVYTYNPNKILNNKTIFDIYSDDDVQKTDVDPRGLALMLDALADGANRSVSATGLSWRETVDQLLE